MKRLRSNGEPTSAESLVFESSGWLSPHPFAESANGNALTPPQTTTTVAGLEPYTEYEFRVVAANMAGSVSSAWTSGRTGESGEEQCFELDFYDSRMKTMPQIKVSSSKVHFKSKNYELT